MTQEQLKEQTINYIEFNLNNQSQLEVISYLLDNISNELYENGYIKGSNTLTTCVLSINEMIKKEVD